MALCRPTEHDPVQFALWATAAALVTPSPSTAEDSRASSSPGHGLLYTTELHDSGHTGHAPCVTSTSGRRVGLPSPRVCAYDVLQPFICNVQFTPPTKPLFRRVGGVN